MKVMMLKGSDAVTFAVVCLSQDQDGSLNWYRLDELLATEKLSSMVEILRFYKENPLVISELISTKKPKVINLASFYEELPFQPLSYRDFMLFEQHYIQAKKGFIKKYFPHILPFINIYERVANKTCPILKPEKRWYQYPIYYLGNHLTFVKSGSEIGIPPYSKELDYELELGAVLCSEIKNATTEQAEQAIGGFVIFNDFSARDVQADEMKCGFGPMKAKNFANSISSIVVTADEILSQIDRLKVRVLINDQLIIESDTRDMHYSLAEAVAYASWEEQLYPGEFVATGTIPGCTGIENGRMLESGDRIRLEIDGIGILENRVA